MKNFILIMLTSFGVELTTRADFYCAIGLAIAIIVFGAIFWFVLFICIVTMNPLNFLKTTVMASNPPLTFVTLFFALLFTIISHFTGFETSGFSSTMIDDIFASRPSGSGSSSNSNSLIHLDSTDAKAKSFDVNADPLERKQSVRIDSKVHPFGSKEKIAYAMQCEGYKDIQYRLSDYHYSIVYLNSKESAAMFWRCHDFANKPEMFFLKEMPKFSVIPAYIQDSTYKAGVIYPPRQVAIAEAQRIIARMVINDIIRNRTR
jgi:hypothetical protein